MGLCYSDANSRARGYLRGDLDAACFADCTGLFPWSFAHNHLAMMLKLLPRQERSKFLSYTAYGIRIGLETTVDVLPYLPSPLIPGAELDATEPPLHVSVFNKRDPSTEI